MMENRKLLKISSKLIFLLWLLWGLHLTQAAGSAETGHFSVEQIPIHQKAYNIEKSVDHFTKTELLTYYIQTDQPAADVLEFYDAYFNGIGWKSSFEICQRHWDDSAVKAEFGELQVKQLYTSWQPPEADLNVSLWLIDKTDITGRQDEILVKFRIKTSADRSQR